MTRHFEFPRVVEITYQGVAAVAAHGAHAPREGEGRLAASSPEPARDGGTGASR